MWWKNSKNPGNGSKTSLPNAKANSVKKRQPLMRALEPRIMFDGAITATAVDLGHAQDTHATDTSHSSLTTAPAAVTESNKDNSQNTVVFVDSRVANSDQLLKNLAPNTQVVYLQADQDGLKQMSDYLSQHQSEDSIQIIAHGNQGDLWLGDTYFSNDTIAQYTDSLAQIGSSIKTGGDILIYACNTAKGDQGMEFVSSLADLTGRDIAASDNRTGTDGDWNLEISTGSIEAKSVLAASSEASYNHDLAVTTVTSSADSGAGTLRNAISSATAGDTITFSSNMTVSLSSISSGQSLLQLNKNLTIDGDLNNDGTADVTLDGQYKGRVLEIASGNTVSLDGLVIEHGLVAGNGGNGGSSAAAALGGGIFNAGTLTLNDVTVTANAAAAGGGGGGVSGGYYGGGGGGGGGIGGATGGHGGSTGLGTGTYAGGAGSANNGGYGGGYDSTHMGGGGGTSSAGGAGGVGTFGYTNGGAGGTASNGTLTIGGGGGGAGWNATGGAGGMAVGGIYNSSSGSLTIVGTSLVTNNLGAGGGGGGGSASGSSTSTNGGDGGLGIGGILNKGGTVNITASNYSAMTGNAGGSGHGGYSTSANNGATPSATSDLKTIGGGTDTSYAPSPTLDSATYNASTGTLTVTGSNMTAGDTIDTTKLTLKGQGGSTYTLTSSSVTASSGTSFTVNLNATDQLYINGLLNKNGYNAVDSTAFNLAGATNWDATASAAADSAATINVSNVAAPTIDTSSATYDASTHVLSVSGSNLVHVAGATNDITVSKLTLKGEGAATYTLTSSNVEITSGSSFAVTLNSTDQAGVASILNKNGTSSSDATTYNLAAADDWNSVITGGNIADTVNGLTASKVAPAIQHLNGDSVAWAGVGNTVNLDAGTAATVGDSVANWAGGSLTIQRSGGAISADTFGFDTSGSPSFSISGSNLQAGGSTFATFTHTGGVLTISFTGSGTTATTSLVQDVAQRITYRNDTPADDATIQFSLSDGNASTTAHTTVTSDTIYVTNTTDTASIDISNGVSFSEAVAIAAADNTGSQTIVFDSSLASTSLTIGNVSVNESLTFDMDSASGISLTGGTITLGAATTQIFTNGTGDTARISSAIAGSGALSKSGAGTLTLSGTNTYTGNTSIAAGDLTLSGGSAIADTNRVDISSGATLTLSNTETVGNLSGAGAIHLGSNDLTTRVTADTTFSGDISGTGGFKVLQTGAATHALTLSGTNTYSGLTTLQGYGWLKLNGDAALADSAAITVNGNSVLTLLSNQTVGSLASLSSTASMDLGSYTLTTGGDNSSTTVSGVISGSGALVKQGSGTMTLGGSNTYSGTTSVNAGTLSLASDSNLGTGSLTLASGTTFDITGATTIDNAIILSGNATVNNSANASLSGIISGANSLTKSGAASLTLAGSNTYSGTTQVSAGTLSVASDSNLGGGTVTLASSTTLAVTGAGTIDNAITLGGNATIDVSSLARLSGNITGAFNLTKTGAGTLALSGTNTYVTTNINAGSLFVASDSYLGSGTVNLADGTTLGITGATTIDNAIAITGTGTINNTAAATLSGIISGGNLTKSGSATLILSGTNTYTGTTDISAGTLSVGADSNLGTGTVNFSGGTLDITGATTIDNAITLSSSATVNTSADTTLSGTISGTGGLSKQGSSTLTLSNTDTYTGATNLNAGTLLLSGALSGTASITVANAATLSGSGSVFASSSSNTLTVQNGGTLSPGNNVGSLTVNGNLTMASGSTLAVDITGTNAGSGYDQVIVNGAVDVTGATLSATHSYTPGSGDSYTIISNDGSDANSGNFNGLAEGDTLTASDNGTVLSASYTGGDGNDFTLAAPIAPQVQSVSSTTANGTYKIGDTLNITVTFSQAVSVNTSGGTPILTLETGTLDRTLNYTSGSGSTTLSFSYTVQEGDSSADLDYLSTSALALNGATIQDSLNHDANLTLAAPGTAHSLGDNKALVIDGVRPTASIAVADTSLTAGETSGVTITFSEAISGLTTSDLTVANGSLSGLSSSDGGTTWTATLTPSANIEDTANIITLDNTGVKDMAGNAGTGTTDSNNYAIDSKRPTVSIAVADTSLTAGETSGVTITFSEAVSGLTTSDLTVANGSLSGLSSSDGGTTWTATLTPSANIEDSANIITLDNTGVKDMAGNAGTGTTDSNNYAIDNIQPTASIVVADTSLTAGETSGVTITFSEAITGLTTSDLTVANGSLSGLSSSDGGTTWTATLTPSANIEDTANIITLDNTGVKDMAGNAGTGTTDSNNYAIDSKRPTASIAVADTSLTAGETSGVTITFSEAISGLTTSDLTVANGSLSGLSSSDGGITWTATLTPSANIEDSANIITLDNTDVKDMAGNAGTGTTDSNNYAIDNIQPTASIAVADTSLTAGETSGVTITFSEAITGLTTSDLTVANGSLSGLSSSDGGTTWTATLTPSANIEDTANIITLDNTGVKDMAGNAGTGTTDSNSYAIDSLTPSVAGVSLPAAKTYKLGDTLDFSVTMSQTVAVDISRGTPRLAIGLDDGNTVYADFVDGSGTASLTFRLTTSNGQMAAHGISVGNQIDLNGGSIQDPAGNNADLQLHGLGSTGGVHIDAVRPNVTAIDLLDAPSPTAHNVDYQVTFNEPVNDLALSDFSLNTSTGLQAQLSQLTQLDDHTWQVKVAQISGSGQLRLDFSGSAKDTAGNSSQGSVEGDTFSAQLPPPIMAPSSFTAPPRPVVSFTASGHDASLIVLNPASATDTQGVLTHVDNPVLTSFIGHSASNPVVTPSGLSGLGLSSVNSITLGSRSVDSTPLGEVGGIGASDTGHDTVYHQGGLDVSHFQSNHSSFVAPLPSDTHIGLQSSPDAGNYHIQPGSNIYITIPGNTFAADPKAQLSVEVKMHDGTPLVKWLHFNAVTGAISGKAPSDFNGHLVLDIILSDHKGNSASSTMVLDFGTPDVGLAPSAHDATVAAQRLPSHAKPALEHQFASHGHQARAQDADALFKHLQQLNQQPQVQPLNS